MFMMKNSDERESKFTANTSLNALQNPQNQNRPSKKSTMSKAMLPENSQLRMSNLIMDLKNCIISHWDLVITG